VALLFVVVVVQIGKIQISEKKPLLEMNEQYKSKSYAIVGNRGKILASDNSILATNLPEYLLYIDMRTPSLRPNPKNLPAANDNAEQIRIKQNRAANERKKNQFDLFDKYINSTSQHLAEIFGNKSAEQYKRELTKAFTEQTAFYKLTPKRISDLQYRAIKQDSLFALGGVKSGLLVEKFTKRIKPFGELASRTVGTFDEYKRTKTGLELSFDNELNGDSGRAIMESIGNTHIERIITEPSDGMDVVTTIETNLQDMAYKTLLKGVEDFGAAEGYAILMEVESGEIKAMVNLQRRNDGSYFEDRNGCVANLSEPGSTFKVVSLMALLDEGKANLNDTIHTGNGVYYYGKAAMKDHNANRGGYGDLTLAQSIYASSNVGVSRAVYKAWGNNQAEYVNKVIKMGLREKFDLHIPGTASPLIKHPKDSTSATWSATTLPWMSVGYETGIPPIYTLAFFNSIANGGKYLEPRVVKAIVKNGEIVKSFETRVINEHICKPEVAQLVKETLHGVVWDKGYATAKTVQSDKVEIAGKTGTAQISKGKQGYKTNGTSYQVSFCGFFPYDKPEYTCVVVLREPSIGAASGGRMSGSIVKSIAEQTMILSSRNSVKPDRNDSTSIKLAKIKPGSTKDLSIIAQHLNLNIDSIKPSEQKIGAIVTDSLGNAYTSMPDCKGWGAKSAIYALKKIGLDVRIAGRGKVVAQTIQPGSGIKPGMSVLLELN
jgi:cell division protein FtsI (penicillin-binding protein 3)